tara:strand:+ start:15046 stop:15792 length:747 start_codon:yes stop_codon:yes gene_type:complete
MQVSQIKEAFKKSGIKKNDSIIVHGDAGIAEQIKINKKDKVNFFLNLLIKLIGEKGSIIVPAFTYNACKTKIFDKQKDKAETGLFSEIFRKKKNINRTDHPIFSFSIYGKNFKYFQKASLNTCFGKKSIFEFFLKKNSKIICLGCELDRITFTHYIEEFLNVSYRYHKKFKIFDKNKKKNITIDYFVRNLNKRSNIDLSKLHKYLIKKKRIKEINFGRFKLLIVESKHFYNSCIELIKKDKNSLIKQN